MSPPDHPPPLPDPEPPPLPADEVIELVPEPVPVVRPARRRRKPGPPEPGFGMAVAWCFGLLASLYIPFAIAAVLTFAVLAIASGDVRKFVQAEGTQMEKVAAAGQAKPPRDPPPMPDGISYAMAAGMAAGHVGSLTFALLLLRFGVGPDWTRKVALRRPPVVPLVLSLMVLPGLILAHTAVQAGLHETAEAVIRLLDPNADTGSSMDAQMKTMMSPWPLWLAVLVMGVGPGVIEEFFCRGFLGRGLVARYGPVGGVLLTSMLFGMLHLLPLYAVGTMVMGALLHVTYLATRSLWVPVLLHFLNNTLSVLAILGVPTLRGLAVDPTELPAAAYLLGFALIGVGMWALWSARARLVSVAPDQPAWRPEYPGVELPPRDSGTVVRHRPPNPVAAFLTLAVLGGLLYFLA
ncbi:MAG TPA: CPBP family intramembrane glutamic endopeptidase [Fimbriiglobus sp.]|nr:CPBP family intramembrane glutamic endopeptidase [Fimbriiglobus sp.]